MNDPNDPHSALHHAGSNLEDQEKVLGLVPNHPFFHFFKFNPSPEARNSVPFGQAPWEPSTEAGYEPEMVMCLGSHGQRGSRIGPGVILVLSV